MISNFYRLIKKTADKQKNLCYNKTDVVVLICKVPVSFSIYGGTDEKFY